MWNSAKLPLAINQRYQQLRWVNFHVLEEMIEDFVDYVYRIPITEILDSNRQCKISDAPKYC